MEVLFIKSPTGVFKLAYSAGETAKLDKKLAQNLIKDGYAIEMPKAESKK